MLSTAFLAVVRISIVLWIHDEGCPKDDELSSMSVDAWANAHCYRMLAVLSSTHAQSDAEYVSKDLRGEIDINNRQELRNCESSISRNVSSMKNQLSERKLVCPTALNTEFRRPNQIFPPTDHMESSITQFCLPNDHIPRMSATTKTSVNRR